MKAKTSTKMWGEEDGRRALLKDEMGQPGLGGGSSMLQDYQVDFQRLSAVAANKVRALKEKAGSPLWSDDVRAAERALEAMESNRRQVQVQMKLELAGSGGSARQEWDARLQEWAREVASFRGELEASREEHGRRSLGLNGRGEVTGVAGAGGGPAGAASHANRQAVSKTTEVLEKSSLKLQEAAAQALEAEEVSQGVLSDLAQQRDTISNVKKSMKTIGAELTSARHSLNRMLQRAAQNSMVTSVICAVLGTALAFWALCFFGMPLKYTLLLAIAAMLIGTALVLLRRRLRAGGARQAAGIAAGDAAEELQLQQQEEG